MSTEAVDAVVIGAGHNGLVAANLLADAGWEVLILEATSEPGGAVRTAELTAPGFRNDVCSAFYPLGAASPVLRELDLESHGLAWRHAPTVLAHVLPDDRCAVLSRDLDETAESVAGFDPRDAGVWREEVARWRRIGEPLLEAILRPFPPVRAGVRLLGRLSAAEALRLARLAARVLPARGPAVGVRDADGETVRARRAVLADVPAPVLYAGLVGLDALPTAFATDVRRFQWDNATIKLDWALSAPIPWTAAGARGAGTVHLGVDLDGLSEYGADLLRGRVPVAPFLLLGQMTTSDPARSPAGTESVWAYTHVPQRLADDIERMREHAELMESVIERHAPGFRASILARHVKLPSDLQEYDPSLFGGAVNGGTAALHQQLIFRPVPGLGRADTPLDRLYLASASAHPGGGVHGAPGANAARAALTRNGPAGGPYGAALRAAHRRLYP